MGELHDILEEAGYMGHELEMYITRLMFCLFAEDTGIFDPSQFTDYLKESKDINARLLQLFDVLNTRHRMKTMPEELRTFLYINGNPFYE
ncbi:MAG: hypothetical protein LBU24_02005 [Methanocalculaceae archaeon]|jgi:hypothetical protein|nr:hypothetical protein [Methanocalculaceae archaeon]